ncbi:hypothetical protein PIGHUM_02664 [Pigmentiphaga humi]|uniref:DUF1640 domain-containing protein n=1 Tax=Pigmentiphaga humi TaxID=2478468 RepID=A0A3P4B4M5_9BURK|nr:DUF1640 domain-containing protein [Pigmentiphaga humi]VCU70588.1 hypothetical protein PIGHUM_02664 [Pigmentiphaga humi]
MTAALTFDTLQYSKRLQQAGMAAPLAEAQAEALAHVLGASTGDLLTHADGERIEASLKGELRLLEQRMTIKLGSLLVVAVGVMAVLDKLL